VVVLAILAVVIPVAVVLSRRNNSTVETQAAADSKQPKNSNLNGVSQSDIPDSAKGGLLDPFSWYDTTDFNVTYTEQTVGGLSVMGLNSSWDDNVQANKNVPNLQDPFDYGKMKIRGINVGGWLNIEPFITPSLFENFKTADGVIDEWTLTTRLGPSKSKDMLEKHYASFVTQQTFVDIRNAGFDHVRIPFNYWAVTTYDGDPYVPKVSWRYLLRGIEWARQQGLRVNLDLHGLPGSQNGWNHSGRQGVVGWLNGTDGAMNGQRSLDIHNQLSQFFSQPRYKNLVTMYGLVNEPRMVDLDTQNVLSWYDKAIGIIRKNNITGVLVFGDGFMGLDKWQGKLQNYDNLLLDVHQYVIFNVDQIALDHSDKLSFACKGWTQQAQRSSDKTTGFGPTLCGEWSQADTDCTEYINNVGWGTRWEGTLNTGNATTSVLSPKCPTKNNPVCSCQKANEDPSNYSDSYKKWLYQFAIAQMESFEQGWGWFYWTWDTEKATQWSYKKGIAAGILPKVVYERDWSCSNGVEDFAGMGLEEFY
jgi:glucan 1,3-beta-glucosidase